MRVVSLLPSATEIVAALGGLDTLVGITHECDHPPQVARLPRVTRSAVTASAPADIDAEVRAVAATGSALYAIDEPAVRGLRPDVILTQALCDVCAVSEDDVRALAARLHPEPLVLTLSASTLDGVFDDIARVAAVLGADDEGAELVAGLRARMLAVHRVLSTARAPRPRVAVIEWSDPVYAAGHWVPEMVRRAGGTDVLAAPGEHSKVVEIDAVARARPELVLFAPCGYTLERAAVEARTLAAQPAWRATGARETWALDANALTSRPGPRLVEGIELMARLFNPSLFTPRDAARATRV